MPTLTTLADVTSSLNTPGKVVLERVGATTVNDEGVAVPGAKSSKILPPTITHPVSGRDRILLPEGVRTRETIVTHTTEFMRTEAEAGPDADVLIHTPLSGVSTRYIVQTVENWGHATGTYRVFATREPAS